MGGDSPRGGSERASTAIPEKALCFLSRAAHFTGIPERQRKPTADTETLTKNFCKDLELQGHHESKNQVPQEIGKEKDLENRRQGTETRTPGSLVRKAKFPRNHGSREEATEAESGGGAQTGGQCRSPVEKPGCRRGLTVGAGPRDGRQ